MKYRDVLLGALAVVAVTSVPVAGQAPQPTSTTAGTERWAPPRTAWGDPDLQGMWLGLTEVPFQRDPKFGTREFLTDAEIAEKIRKWDAYVAAVDTGTVEQRGFRNFPTFRTNPLEVPSNAEPGGRPEYDRRTAAIVDPPNGRLPPMTPEAVQRYEAKDAAQRGRGESDSWIDRWFKERCMSAYWAPMVTNWGLGYGKRGLRTFEEGGLAEAAKAKEGLVTIPGGVTGQNKADPGSPRRFLQTPGYVAITYEEYGGSGTGAEQDTYRIIPLDGRPAPGAKIRTWMGASRGHWEGNTLVVVTRNIYYDDPILPTYGHHGLYPGTGETLTVTERFKPVSANTLEYSYTVDDPETYIRPYTVLQTLSRNDAYAIDPGMCHENNWRFLGGQLAQGRTREELSIKYAADSARLRQERMEELKAEWAEEWAKLKGNPSR